MTTLQDIDKREEELKVIEVQAQRAERTKIPERKYGAGVTRENQQQAYTQRKEGRRVLGEVKTQRENLKNLRTEVIAYNQRQEEIRKLEKEKKDYERGYKLGQSGNGLAVLGVPKTKAGRQGFEDAINQEKYYKEKAEYNKQVSKLKEQGLTPVYNKGKLVGFEDSVRQQSIGLQEVPKLPESDLSRYEKAGAITRELENKQSSSISSQEKLLTNLGIPLMSTAEGVVLANPPATPKRYNPKLLAVEKIIEYPFNKLSEAYNKTNTRNPDQKVLIMSDIGGYNYISTKGEQKELKVQAIKEVGSFISYPVYGARRIEQLTFDSISRREFRYLSLPQKGLEVVNIGLSLYSAGSLAKAGFKFAKEPITIKTTKIIPDKYISNTEVYNIMQGGKRISVAEFEVIRISNSVKVYQVPRWSATLRGLKINDPRLTRFSLEDLKVIAPEGKILEIRQATVTRSVTEPFIIQNGRIITSTKALRNPGVFNYKITSYGGDLKYRITSKEISILSGRTYPERRISSLSKSRSELPSTTQKGLEELEKLPAPEGLTAKKVYEPPKGVSDLDKGPKFSQGDLELKKILKLTNKEIKLVPEGRRTTRADVTTIQESLAKIKYSDKGALKELEILKEDIAAIDTTFPRFNKPRKAIKIEGKTQKYEIDLSPEESLRGKMGGRNEIKDTKIIEEVLGKSQVQKSINQEETTKILSESIGNVAVQQSNIKIPNVKIKAPEIKTDFTTETASAFAGTGLYERTEGGSLPGIKQNSKVFMRAPEFNLKSAERININSLTKLEVQNNIKSRSNLKNNTKMESDLLIKSDILQKNAPKLSSITKQTPRTITKQTPRTITKTPSFGSPLFPKVPKIPKNPTKKNPPVKFSFPSGNFKVPKVKEEFKIFGKRFGKFKEIGGAETKEEAKSLFLRFQKGTLGRSAYVQEGTKKLTLKELGLGNEFRASKKSETIIVQKSKYSLGTTGEVKEIQGARKIRI